MAFWKPKSKLAGKVFAILRLRPTIDKEEPEPMKGLAGDDHADHRPPSRSLPTSMIGWASNLVNTTTVHLDTSAGLLDSISSSDDPIPQVHNHQKCVCYCSFLVNYNHSWRTVYQFHPRHGYYCNWRDILCRWRRFRLRTKVKNCHTSWTTSKLRRMLTEPREFAEMFAEVVCAWGLGSPLSSKSRPAGNCCWNDRQEIGRGDRPLAVTTRYLNGVLICKGCNRSTTHT